MVLPFALPGLISKAAPVAKSIVGAIGSIFGSKKKKASPIMQDAKKALQAGAHKAVEEINNKVLGNAQNIDWASAKNATVSAALGTKTGKGLTLDAVKAAAKKYWFVLLPVLVLVPYAIYLIIKRKRSPAKRW